MDGPRPAIIDIHELRFGFRSAAGSVDVIDMAAWSLPTGALVVIEGPSGCGKSTFLNVLGGMLPAWSGTVRICGTDLSRLDEASRDRWRADHIGIIFQGLNLLPGFTALENVMLGLTFSATSGTWDDARVLLAEVGLGHRLHHRPGEMSLGEQQRVAIARALIKKPRLILADEPTGSLDPRNAAEIAALLRRICAEHACSLVMVCHQPEVAAGFPMRQSFADINRTMAVDVPVRKA